MTHLLVTNDYPPKVGGIQSYLFELWKRVPSERFVVLTTKFPGSEQFDTEAPHRIVRLDRSLFFPTRSLVREIRGLAEQIDASLVVLDPLFPLGALASHLHLPYAVVLHGAEVTVPRRLPGVRQLLKKTIAGAEAVIAAGEYPAREARRIAQGALPRTIVVPPGVDTARFRPLEPDERASIRAHYQIAPDAELIVSVSRLVPRKGMDVLIEAAARLMASHPKLRVLIAGSGRDEARLLRLIEEHHAPVELVGAVSDEALPGFYGAADVFAMFARDRWLGLEQEGFGIVYLEAAACGVTPVAGRSGGTIDAVKDGVSGLVLDRPADVVVATEALCKLLDDEALRARLGGAAHEHAIDIFHHDVLARTLNEALVELEA